MHQVHRAGVGAVEEGPQMQVREAVRGGIVAGSLMVVTLSMGEFNLTWLLHTPLTKTLPEKWRLLNAAAPFW